MLHRPNIILLTGMAMLLTAAVQAKSLNVSLVLSDSSTPYRQFADAFNSAVAASKADIRIIESPAIGANNADLIVAVGTKAAEHSIAQADTPVLVAMVTDTGYRALLAQHNIGQSSAIYLNQPWNRQLDFLRAALPERRRIGLLYSPATRIDIGGLRMHLAAHGGSLLARPVRSDDELFSVLESVLSDSDILLAIPDSAIYSSNNIRNILLTSYRKNVPLVGISKAYVNAGALCAIFSTPEQLGVQAGAAVILFSRDRQLPAPQYPSDFTIAANQLVAQSLGVELPSQQVILGQMDKIKEQNQ